LPISPSRAGPVFDISSETDLDRPPWIIKEVSHAWNASPRRSPAALRLGLLPALPCRGPRASARRSAPPVRISRGGGGASLADSRLPGARKDPHFLRRVGRDPRLSRGVDGAYQAPCGGCRRQLRSPPAGLSARPAGVADAAHLHPAP